MANTFVISVSDPKFATAALIDQMKRNHAGRLSQTAWIIEVEGDAQRVLDAVAMDAGANAGIAVIQVMNRGSHVGRHLADKPASIMSKASIR